MPGSPLHGVVHGDANGNISHLPLEEVHLNVFLLDVSARVTLRQKFSNPSELATGRAKYVFPVPARSAVSAFEMQFADGHVVKGVAKERERASEEYKTAVRQGKAAAIVDWVTDGLFTISLGSIPARQTVTAKLVLVMDLMDDELKDQVRLLLPVFMGCRYGVQPETLVDAVSASIQTRLRIAVDIQMSGVIQDVSSPSHRDLKLEPYVTRTGKLSRRRTIAKFRSPTFLTDNFVLTVRADGLDAPRCFAERDSGLVALQLTMVPKFKLPPIPAQEYIFLVDRSGSMAAGNSIEICKHALSMLLPMLPNADTFFNIFSFGSQCDSLWPGSRRYDEDSRRDANDHILSMQANYGGTELNAALDSLFNHRNLRVPTLVFVLTDGQFFDVDLVLRTVRSAVSRATPDAPLRVFSLGIGAQVTTEVVEGIASEGGGECYFAVKSETITGKCAKLLRAGRSSFVEDISIDWGISDRRQANASAPFSVDLGALHVELAPPPIVQQVPDRITKIYPGTRFIVFALTTQTKIPENVTLRGRLNGHEPIEIIVPVTHVGLFNNKKPDISLVHTLAARRLITDLTEDRAPLPVATNPSTLTEDDIRKAAIVRLGVEYQLASRYTSFVGVDDGRDTLRVPRQSPTTSRRGRTTAHSGDDRTIGPSTDNFFSSESFAGPALNFGWNILTSLYSVTFGIFDGGENRIRRRQLQRPPGAYSTSSSSSSISPGFVDDQPIREEPEDDRDSTDTFSTLSSLESCISDWSFEQHPPVQDEPRSPSPTIDDYTLLGNDPNGGVSQLQQQTLAPPPPPVPKEVFNLVQLQQFDGRFKPDSELGRIVGQAALQKPTDIETNDTMWATAVAVAYLRKHLALVGYGDLLDGFLDKVMEYVGEDMRTDFEGWVARASQLVA